ncbi:hypothetical protein V8C40DRAFT_201106 [Trichoderma camerunense]
MASAMASPYSVPHSRSTLGVKVLQPMLMLFSPEAGVGSRSLDATSQQSSLSSQARLARVSSGTDAWCLTLALLRSWNCPARRGLLRSEKRQKTPRREAEVQCRGAARPSPSTRSSNSVRVTSSSLTPTDQASCTGEYLHVSLQGLAGRR